MSKTRNKGKTRRVIPKQAIMTVATVRKFPRRSQGPKKYPFAKLKAAMRHYINRCPALTSNTKRVGILLVDWYNPGRRKAWCSLATIADELSMARSTVSTAIATLHDLELVFAKSGGFGAVANEFVPNFWLVLNPTTGAVIKQANYDVSAGKWRTSAESVSDFRAQNSVSENRGQETTENRRNSAESVSDFRGPYSDNGMGGAPASPASADATADCATAPCENNSGSDWTHPRDMGVEGESLELFLKLENLNISTGVEPENFLASIGKSRFAGQALNELCCNYRFTCNLSNPITEDEPEDDSTLVYVDVIAGETVYRETMLDLNPDHVTGKDYVCIDFWVSKTFRESLDKQQAGE